MNKDVYLTVDLDYWYHNKIGDGYEYIRKLYELRRPITVYTQHQLVLKDITNQYRKVYNVDFHSDICNTGFGWPNCGTWGNRVYGRHEAEFDWRYPSYNVCISDGYGLCHDGHQEDSPINPFTHPEFNLWKKISRHKGLDEIELNKVDKISLILSIAWSTPIVIHDTLRFIKNNEGPRIQFYGNNVIRQLSKMIAWGERQW